ncbi:hypothetical protein GQ600_12126 [Phytophthora cactorum]|nr:hypothetical protein GQ600_12126 [Phytophthora cactorum]
MGPTTDVAVAHAVTVVARAAETVVETWTAVFAEP